MRFGVVVGSFQQVGQRLPRSGDFGWLAGLFVIFDDLWHPIFRAQKDAFKSGHSPDLLDLSRWDKAIRAIRAFVLPAVERDAADIDEFGEFRLTTKPLDDFARLVVRGTTKLASVPDFWHVLVVACC